jgi:hypothetical protein
VDEMTLHDGPIEQAVTLPDGRSGTVRIGLLPDPYVAEDEIDTVSVELLVDGSSAAFVNTVLEPDPDDEARELAETIARALATGEAEPTAGGIAPLALGA